MAGIAYHSAVRRHSLRTTGELIRVTAVEENSSIITLDIGNIPVGIYHIIFDSTKSGRNIGSFIKN
jgi:hypothetical protein